MDLTKLNGGGGLIQTISFAIPNNNCAKIMPHQYLRVNTIFEVVKANGGYTAWTDKHPSYEWTNGPSGRGVDDFTVPRSTRSQSLCHKFPAAAQSIFRTPHPMMAGRPTYETSSATTTCT